MAAPGIQPGSSDQEMSVLPQSYSQRPLKHGSRTLVAVKSNRILDFPQDLRSTNIKSHSARICINF